MNVSILFKVPNGQRFALIHAKSVTITATGRLVVSLITSLRLNNARIKNATEFEIPLYRVVSLKVVPQ